MDEEIKEELAEYAHQTWNGWMLYLFSKCRGNKSGSMTIPAWTVDRWKRQMRTAYCDLPEEEKNSDREEARQMIQIIENNTEED